VSASEGTRLLGLVEVRRGEILALVEQKQCMCCVLIQLTDHYPDHYNDLTAFSQDLIKVNHDGPSLKISAGFTVSSPTPYSVVHQIATVENQSKTHV
jgi:hypothetical protein